ncbi:hypothetical protein [Streptomyces sp. NRRL WC-3549]|uniref:hypothetical protein n=1 Tax=Streptomyces sp. NRRL WC-3549 TaxID=1463925 RepID=UPI002D21BFDF|nr:hypothetical protein [Streptomyces sp. NRRL WC-3549]
MTYRRAVIPALVGGVLLTALLWWAGASVEALHLQGATDALGGRMVADLQYWLSPWAYDPPEALRLGSGGLGDTGVDGARYLSLHETGMQVRFAALFVFFVPGALLLVRRLPPVNRRAVVTLLAVWGWGTVAGMLAVTVSAPWLIVSSGRGSYRFLPQLASMMSSGQQITVVAALVTAAVTVLVAWITAKGAGPLPLGVCLLYTSVLGGALVPPGGGLLADGPPVRPAALRTGRSAAQVAPARLLGAAHGRGVRPLAAVPPR